jgi:ribosomal protein S17E
MASVLKGRIKVSPGGLSSVIVSHIVASVSTVKSKRCVNSMTGEVVDLPLSEVAFPWQSCQSSATSIDSSGESEVFDSLPPGKGGLGKKNKASWRSCRGVRERMAAVELEYGVKNCKLLTVTLPSVDSAAFEGLARYSSYAIDRLNREFKRYFSREETTRISVWEYQKRGALHCHILLASASMHKISDREISEYFACVWYRTLLSIADRFPCNPLLRKDGKSWKLSQLKKVVNRKKECVFVNVQRVRKSVVAYLSKYLADSNHEEKNESKQSLRTKFFPIATWFQWSRSATKLMDKYTDEFDLGYCEPDRKKEIQRIIEQAEKDILNNVELAKNTEIKRPQNPYNVGLYWLPKDKKNAAKSGEIMANYIEKMSHFFKIKTDPMQLRQTPIYEKPENEDVDIYIGKDDFMQKYYSRYEEMIGSRSQDWGDFIADFGLNMLQFCESICYDLTNETTYFQLDLFS